MRGNPHEHYRPRARLAPADDADAGPSDEGVFEELEVLAKSPEFRRVFTRVWTAAVRGAAAGVLIKGGLHTLTFFVYLLSRLRGKGRQRMTTLVDALRDTVLHTCFLAALGSSYTAVDEGIALIFGKSYTQRWRALLAGLVAGQSLRITGAERRHYSLATYILLRGLTLLIRTGNKPGAPPALRALLRPTRTANGDTLLMCAAASQILYSFIMEPSTLPPTYVRFITRMGAKDPAVWAAIREQAMRNAAGLHPGPLQALARTPLAYLNARPGRLRTTPCEFFHPGQSCLGHGMGMVPKAYSASLAVYVPFYLVSSVLVHRTALLARPRELLPKMAVAVLRSSAFLSSYISLAFLGACTGFCVSGTNTGPVVAASVWAGGLATLLEKKSRRMELAMYCSARALEAFIRCCWLWGQAASQPGGPTSLAAGMRGPHRPGGSPAALRPGAARWPLGPQPLGLRRPLHRTAAASPSSSGGLASYRLDVLLFSLGCGAIMHCYSDACGEHRDVFRSKYLNVLDFIFGNQGVQQGSITHVPTNLELVSTVRSRLRSMSRGMLSSTTTTTGGAYNSGSYSPLTQSFSQSFTTTQRAAAAAAGGGLTDGSTAAATSGSGGGGSRRLGHAAHENSSGSFGDGLKPAALQPIGASPSGGMHSDASLGVRGHPHHGAHGYQRFLQLQHEQQERHHSQEVSCDASDQQPLVSSGTVAVAVAAVPVAAEAAAPTAARGVLGSGRQGSGDSSSSSEWEEVWAAATANSKGTAAVTMTAVSSTGVVTVTGTGGKSGISGSAGSGTLSWAARLVASALGGGASGADSGGGGGGGAAAIGGRAASTAAIASSGHGMGHSGEGRVRGRSSAVWGLNALRGLADGAGGGGGSLRRNHTAPHGLRSKQALLLMSDPDTEHRGHGRSSYTMLQHLSGGGGLPLAATGGSEGSSSALATSAPSGSSHGLALAAMEVRAASAPTGTAALSLPAGPPSKARPVPVPSAGSRAPAFHSSRIALSAMLPSHPPLQALVGGTSTGRATSPRGGSAATAAAGGGAGAGHSVESCLDRLANCSFSIRNPGGGRASRGSAEGHAVAAAAGDAVTFAPPGGAWTHPSPVSGAAPSWPRLSLDYAVDDDGVAPRAGSMGDIEALWRQADSLVTGSAPEARGGSLAAEVLAAAAVQHRPLGQQQDEEEPRWHGRGRLEGREGVDGMAAAAETGLDMEVALEGEVAEAGSA